MLDKERTEQINIGGEKFNLILTTKAVKEIALKYGSLEALGEKISDKKDMASTFSELIWLLVLLANQAILIHNFKNPNDKKELLTEEFVELFTTPDDLIKINSAISKTLTVGFKRNIKSSEIPKNAKTG